MAQRYTKRRSTTRGLTKTSRAARVKAAATSAHNEKLAKALSRARVPKQSDREARYARRDKVGRRRRRERKSGGWLDNLLKYRVDLDARNWFKAKRS